jgi:hypothetical protein
MHGTLVLTHCRLRLILTQIKVVEGSDVGTRNHLCTTVAWQDYTEQPGIYTPKTFASTFDDTGITIISDPKSIETGYYDGLYCTSRANAQPCSKNKKTFFFPFSTPNGYPVNYVDSVMDVQCNLSDILIVTATTTAGKVKQSTLTCDAVHFEFPVVLYDDPEPIASLALTTTFRNYWMYDILFSSSDCSATVPPVAPPTKKPRNMSMSMSMSKGGR